MQLSPSQRRLVFVSDVLIVAAASIVGAVAWVSFAGGDKVGLLLWAIGGTVVLGAFWKYRPAMMAGFLCLGIACCGVWAERAMDLSWTEVFAGHTFSGEVVVTSTGVLERYGIRYPVRTGEGVHPPMVVRTEIGREYEVGDVVRVSCVLEVPERGDDGTDWLRIFAARSPVLFCPDDHPQRTGERREDWRSFFADLRSGAERVIDKSVPYPESALAQGLLFGGTSGLTEEWQQNLRILR